MLKKQLNIYEGVAQTVEQQVETLCVGGAIPSPFTIICRLTVNGGEPKVANFMLQARHIRNLLLL